MSVWGEGVDVTGGTGTPGEPTLGAVLPETLGTTGRSLPLSGRSWGPHQPSCLFPDPALCRSAPVGLAAGQHSSLAGPQSPCKQPSHCLLLETHQQPSSQNKGTWGLPPITPTRKVFSHGHVAKSQPMGVNGGDMCHLQAACFQKEMACLP